MPNSSGDVPSGSRPGAVFDDPRPYAYQTGRVEFFYLPFRSDERALVPRLETESLVREVLAQTKSGEFAHVVDVGTGSGIIAVSVAKNRPEIRVCALDLSEEALSLAKENARSNGAEIEFVRSDLLRSLPETVGDSGNVFFVANLPYVREGAGDMSPDTAYEPAMALYGGSGTGFELTARFLREVEDFRLRHPDVGIAVACEVGDDHEEEIRKIASELGRDIRIFADLSGIRRFFTYRVWPS